MNEADYAGFDLIADGPAPDPEPWLEGDCLAFAFALNWSAGFEVEAVSERGSDTFLHFAAIGPDGAVWDAAGPRPREVAAAAYARDPVWEPVDAYKFVSRGGCDEDDINVAFVAAARIFGPLLRPLLKRVPDIAETAHRAAP